MWLRLLAGGALVAGTTVLGYQAAGALQRRCSDLGALSRALEVLVTEISYGSVPLGPALARSARAVGGGVGALLEQAATRIDAGETPGDALTAAVAATGNRTGLAPADQTLLLTLVPVLGQSGKADQLRHLARLQGELTAAREAARDRATRYEPVCRYGGALSGLAILLLLI